MRAAVLLAAGAVVAQASSVVPVDTTVVECAPLSTWTPTNSSGWPVLEPTKNMTATPLPTNSPNATITTDVIVSPSETSGEPVPTAGAISQPLQSSMVGLLGFVIVGLILV